jgi:hypothetical protein
MTTATMTTESRVFALSTLTTRDEAGRHFTERYDDATLADLESEGLIEINRPVHRPTGISYDCQYWTVEVTPSGVELVEANPEYWDTGVRLMIQLKTEDWCVCGQEPDGPWEAVEARLESREVAEAWLRTNFARFPEFSAWYVDRADNDGHAESYWSIRDGDLVHTN